MSVQKITKILVANTKWASICTPVATSLLISSGRSPRLAEHNFRFVGTSSHLGGDTAPECPPAAPGLLCVLRGSVRVTSWRGPFLHQCDCRQNNCLFRRNFSEVAQEINFRLTTPEMNALPLDQLLNKQKMLIHSICLHKRVIIVSDKMIQT